MTKHIILSEEKGPKLHFIPPKVSVEFIKHVIERYAFFGDGKDFPDLGDIALQSNGFYLKGSTYQDTGDPDAYSNLMDSVSDPEEKDELWNSLYEQFDEPQFFDYKEMFMDDIQSVMNFYNMSHMFCWSHPLEPVYIQKERFNIPIIEVW
jgi:hypothetical protein